MGYKLLIVLVLFLISKSVVGQRYVYVDKSKLSLYVIENSNKDTIATFLVGIGKKYGDKKKKGDMKTPEGVFTITEIIDSSSWEHDFKDGYGSCKGAYCPYFIRLKTTPFSGIGIHGTCFPNSIGSRCSEGCIRMRNDDIISLRELVRVGMYCVISEDRKYPCENDF